MKAFWKILQYFLGTASFIGIVIGIYTYAESFKPKPITKDDVKVIVKEAVDPIKEGISTITTIQADIIYNQNVLKNDWLMHISKDSTAKTIIKLMNEFRSNYEVLKKKRELLDDSIRQHQDTGRFNIQYEKIR